MITNYRKLINSKGGGFPIPRDADRQRRKNIFRSVREQRFRFAKTYYYPERRIFVFVQSRAAARIGKRLRFDAETDWKRVNQIPRVMATWLGSFDKGFRKLSATFPWKRKPLSSLLPERIACRSQILAVWHLKHGRRFPPERLTLIDWITVLGAFIGKLQCGTIGVSRTSLREWSPCVNVGRRTSASDSVILTEEGDNV